MVDRGWKNSHKDSTVQVVPFWGIKDSQILRRRYQYQGPAAANLQKRPIELSTVQHDATPLHGPRNGSENTLMAAQKFKFVIVADPVRGGGSEVRKLVRSHVMKGSRRNQKPRRKPAQEITAILNNIKRLSTAERSNKPETKTAHSSELSLVLAGSGTSFYGVLPCSLKPHYYSLLNYCM